MTQTWLVLKHEIVTTLSKRSYWLMTFLFPIAVVAFTAFSQVSAERLTQEASADMSEADAATFAIGYVDPGSIIAVVPTNIPQGMLREYPDAESAVAALAAGDIDAYVLVPADYAQGTPLTVVDSEFNLFGSERVTSLAGYVLNANLLASEEMARVLQHTAGDSRWIREYRRLQESAPEPTGEGDGAPITGAGSMILPYAVMFILFSVLSSGGGYVLHSVSSEKENRTVEMLLVSVSPRALMLGKVIGLGAVSLMQMVIWVAVGGLALEGGLTTYLGALDVSLPAGLGAYLIVYVALGYLSYAASLAAIGALAPNLREGAQFQFLVLLPLLLPLFLYYPLTEEPNGVLAVVLSLVPFSAPMAMALRLTMTAVPGWQVAVSIAGMAATSYVLVVLAARFFRADTLLSGAAITWSRLASEIRRALRG